MWSSPKTEITQQQQPPLSRQHEDQEANRHHHDAPQSTPSLPPPAADLEVPLDDESYPEGGAEAWLVVLGAWCAMFTSMGLLNTLGILQAWVQEHQLAGMPESTVGWIFSVYAFLLYFCGAQVGPIVDAHDIRVVIIPGSIGIVLSLVFTSLSTEYYQFLLSFGVLGGVSASLLFNPALAAVGHWFSKRRGLATGAACTAGGIGGILFPLTILYAAPRLGFPWSVRLIALVCALSGLAACLLLRKRLPPPPPGRRSAAIDLVALAEPRYAATTLAIFLVEFAVFIPYSYIPSYALHAGFPPDKAYLLNTLLNVGAVPGRALPGYLADRFGVFNTMCATALACTALIFTLWLSAGDNQAMTTAFTVLYGFWSGAAIALTPVCIGKVCAIGDYGKRNGSTYFVASFGALTGIPIAGAVLQAGGGSYAGLIVLAGVFYAASLAAFWFARGIAGGWRLRMRF